MAGASATSIMDLPVEEKRSSPGRKEKNITDVLGSEPQEAGGRRVIFVSGDDADAKAHVIALFQDAGFAAIDRGDLATGGAMQEIHHPLAGVNLIRLLGA
jgi:predicted dinucleotide-binding enzyme